MTRPPPAAHSGAAVPPRVLHAARPRKPSDAPPHLFARLWGALCCRLSSSGSEPEESSFTQNILFGNTASSRLRQQQQQAPPLPQGERQGGIRDSAPDPRELDLTRWHQLPDSSGGGGGSYHVLLEPGRALSIVTEESCGSLTSRSAGMASGAYSVQSSARRLPAEGSLAGVATLPTMPPPVAAIHKGAGDPHPDQAFAYVGVEER